jgi:DNA adenine methylase
MAVLGHKPLAAMETVNDLNGDLINLARVIKDETQGPKLYRMCRRTLVHEDLYEEAKARSRARWDAGEGFEGPDLDRAYDYFIVSWMGRNGTAGTCSTNQNFAMRYTHGGGSPGQRWCTAARSINWWRKRLARVMITSRDLFEMVEQIQDDAANAIYIDPPYVTKGAKYLHDFADDDHARLAGLASRFTRTRVVISYYDHPLVRELYAGWTFVDCAMNKALVNQGQRDRSVSAVAPEVLIINGASRTQTASLFGGAHA